MIQVFIERENKKEEVKADTAGALLQQLKINPETVLIVKDDKLITEDTKLSSNDKIKLLSVISGG